MLPALPLDEAGKYVAAAYLVFVALILIYVVIMASKLSRIEREVVELAELAELGDGAASGLYQIVREALDQTVRRGPPTTVRIDFHPTASGGVELTVADDAAPERRQAVLDGLAERAADLNAVLVDDRNETGTSVTVTLPPSAARL